MHARCEEMHGADARARERERLHLECDVMRGNVNVLLGLGSGDEAVK